MSDLLKLVKYHGLFKFYRGTYEKYLALESKDQNGLYFIEDKGVIIKGENLQNTGFIMYESGKRPFKGDSGKIYIDNESKIGYIYNDEEDQWVRVFDGYNKANDLESIATGFLTKSITDDLIRQAIARTITDITYDENEKTISYIKNGNVVDVAKLDFGSRLDFDVETNSLNIIDNNGNIISSTFYPDRYIIGGKYDDDEKAIIFDMSDGTKVRLRAFDLLNIYGGKKTSSGNMIVESYIDGRNIIKAEVRISPDPRNLLTVESDGLYVDVDTDGDIVKPSTGTGENILVADSDGNYVESPYTLTSGKDNSVATELYVKEALDSIIIKDPSTNSEIYATLKDLATEKRTVEALTIEEKEDPIAPKEYDIDSDTN